MHLNGISSRLANLLTFLITLSNREDADKTRNFHNLLWAPPLVNLYKAFSKYSIDQQQHNHCLRTDSSQGLSILISEVGLLLGLSQVALLLSLSLVILLLCLSLVALIYINILDRSCILIFSSIIN